MTRIIKKISWQHLIALVCLLGIFLIPYLVFAGPVITPEQAYAESQKNNMTAESLLEQLGEKAGYETGVGKNNINNIIVAVINGVLGVLGIIFFIYVFHAGYLWMTAQGNEEQVTKAKGEITNAIIGLVIIVAAYAIVNYVIFALLESYGGGGVGGGTP